MADGATIPVNDDGSIDRINIGGVEHMFKLTVNEESLEAVNSAAAAANAAATSAAATAAEAKTDMEAAADRLRSQVLDVLGCLSIDESGRICVSYTREDA